MPSRGSATSGISLIQNPAQRESPPIRPVQIYTHLPLDLPGTLQSVLRSFQAPTSRLGNVRLREDQGESSSWVLEMTILLEALEGEEILSSLIEDRAEEVAVWDGETFGAV